MRTINVSLLTIASILAILVVMLSLSGCGSSSGAGMSVAGVISDVEGNLVPNARVTVTGSDGRATTSFNGAYRLDCRQGGWQTVTATATIDGRTWIGRQSVQVFTDGPTQNVNIVIGDQNKLGSIAGTVRTSGGQPLEGVRVFVATTYGSQFDITSTNGSYRIDYLPASVRVDGADTTISYVMTASKVGYANQTRSEDDGDDPITVEPGGVTNIDFVIEAVTGSLVPIPDPFDIDVIAWTFPENVSRSFGAYDAVRAAVSPRFKKMLSSKSATRAVRLGSMIEIDVSWYSSWTDFLEGGNPPDNLAGFVIYRRSQSQPDRPSDRIYFERQPLLTDFFDMDSNLTDGVRYYYRISAVNTNYLDGNDEFNPQSESALSNTASATPMDQILGLSPSNGITVNSGLLGASVRFSWTSLPRARSYKVFVYDRFPELQGSGVTPFPDQVVEPIAEVGPVSGTFVQDTLDVGTYYWVVIAADSTDFDFAGAYSISELRKITIR